MKTATREIKPSTPPEIFAKDALARAEAFLKAHPASENFKRTVKQCALKMTDDEISSIPGSYAPREKISKQIRLALYTARDKAGLSQSQLAKKMGMLQPAVSRIENAANLSLKSLADYLAACGCTIEIKVKKLP